MTFGSEDVLRALYRAAFNREPDPPGLEAYNQRLSSDPEQLGTIAGEIFHSEERQRLPDHSQFGEFGIVLRLLVGRSTRHGIIVDVGARGRERSNSYDLLRHFGWRGLLVEANPALYEQILSEFAGTNFQLEKCAVGPSEGTLPFYIGMNDDVSSLDQRTANSWGDLRGTQMVQVKRLSSVLAEHSIPHDFDILSLDIEGLDVVVFDDLIVNSEFRPRLVIMEASFGFQTKRLEDLNAASEVCSAYEIVSATEANLILAKLGD